DSASSITLFHKRYQNITLDHKPSSGIPADAHPPKHPWSLLIKRKPHTVDPRGKKTRGLPVQPQGESATLISHGFTLPRETSAATFAGAGRHRCRTRGAPQPVSDRLIEI